MSRKSDKAQKAKRTKDRKPIVMENAWKQEYLIRVKAANDWVASGEMARNVPKDYIFNQQTGDFHPPAPKKEE